jgi:hypothetical protein
MLHFPIPAFLYLDHLLLRRNRVNGPFKPELQLLGFTAPLPVMRVDTEDRRLASQRRNRLHSAVPDGLGGARGGKKCDQPFRTSDLARTGDDCRD